VEAEVEDLTESLKTDLDVFSRLKCFKMEFLFIELSEDEDLVSDLALLLLFLMLLVLVTEIVLADVTGVVTSGFLLTDLTVITTGGVISISGKGSLVMQSISPVQTLRASSAGICGPQKSITSKLISGGMGVSVTDIDREE
jgi:hypothetical protein